MYIVERGTPGIRYANLSTRAVKVLGITVAPGTIERVAGSRGPCAHTDPYNLASLQESVLAARDACIAPYDIALGSDGDLFFTDLDHPGVYRITAHGDLELVLGRDAGSAFGMARGEPQAADYGWCGEGGSARGYPVCLPIQVEVDPAGNVYVGQSGGSVANPGAFNGNRIDVMNRQDRAITVHGVTIPPGEVGRIFGAGRSRCSGSTGDRGPARQASMCSLRGLRLIVGRL